MDLSCFSFVQLIFATEYTCAEGASWHTNHFCCWLCDGPLAGLQYTPVDGQPHCLDCYQKKYGKVLWQSHLLLPLGWLYNKQSKSLYSIRHHNVNFYS